ncbi:MAG: lipid-binding SYLF domain-containing protein [Sandaracinaceae bacterium]|nr:lipid-binding SYLF domain-containing protein [Sandaracinaceae bacterium]
MTTCSRLYLSFVVVALASACASVPQEAGQRQALVSQANATVQMMTARDPSLRDLLERSHGYAVFPSVGEVGVIAVGSQQGVGVVFEQGRAIGFARIREITVGPQLGGQSFSQIIVFEDRAAFDRMRAGNFDLTAGARGTVLGWGAGAQTQFEGGVAVIVSSEKGLMAGATVGGQSIRFEPMA